MQDIDTVRDARELIEVVPGHQHRSAAPGHLPQKIPESDDRQRIEPIGWLIEDDDVRFMRQGADEPHFLARTQ